MSNALVRRQIDENGEIGRDTCKEKTCVAGTWTQNGRNPIHKTSSEMVTNRIMEKGKKTDRPTSEELEDNSSREPGS